MIDAACGAYVRGEIEIDELERAIEHVLKGGVGNAEFPYLPCFTAGATETVLA